MRENWEVLREAIPPGSAAAVARRLHLNADYVACWMRERGSDEAPLANGKRSILDRFIELQDAIYLVNRSGPLLLIEHLRAHYEELTEASADPDYWDRRAHAAYTLQEVVDAVKCLNLDADDDETMRELLEAREAIDTAIKRVRQPRGSEGGEPARASRSGVLGETPGSTRGEKDHA